MSEILFDSFDPNDACLSVPPPGAPDDCRILANFHQRGEGKAGNLQLTFRRARDHFALVTRGSEAETALVRGLGFNEFKPELQSRLFYSVAFHQWIQKSYQNLDPARRREMPWFLPTFAMLRNFLVTGTIEPRDDRQRGATAALLLAVFALPPEGRKPLASALRILSTSNQAFIVPEMRPRIQWLQSLSRVFPVLGDALSFRPQGDALRTRAQTWARDVLIYLGTGIGSWPALQRELDSLVVGVARHPGTRIGYEDLYGFFLSRLEPLRSLEFFKSNSEGRGRWREVSTFLRSGFEERRSDLLYLGARPQTRTEAFRRSIALRLEAAAASGALISRIRDEAEKFGLDLEWQRKREHVAPVHEAVASALSWIPGPGYGKVRVDFEGLRARLEALFRERSVHRRDLRLAALAALRSVFGDSGEADKIEAWVGDRWATLPLEFEAEQQRALQRLLRRLERRLLPWPRQAGAYLPWVEGGLCALGLGAGGAGLGIHRREALVSGGAVAGLGCGALGGHFVLPSRKVWWKDLVGGLLGAGLGFGLSYGLSRTQRLDSMPMPPGASPGRRHPTDPYGP